MGEVIKQFLKVKVWNKMLVPFGRDIKGRVIPGLKQSLKDLFLTLLHPFKSCEKGLFDITYFILVMLILVYGLVVHYSASYLNLKQAGIALVGVGIMIFVSQIRVDVLRKVSVSAMALTFVTLIAVFGAPEKNGTHRWLFFFQPSEIAKIAMIMFFAFLLEKYWSQRREKLHFYTFFFITLFLAVLVFLEGHLSGCILFLCIGYALMWYSDPNRKSYTFWLVMAICAVAIVAIKPEILTLIPKVRSYQIKRILVWKQVWSGEPFSSADRNGDARQILQSMNAIGSGGLFGQGFGNSGQKYSLLSESENDFIFAVLAEELGFVGCMILVALFAILVFKGFKIGLECKSPYGMLLCFGISTQIALQVLINIAVTTSVLPNTGISLPFFSDGGSSLLFTLFSMGLVLAVSRENIKRRKLKNAKQ